MNIEKKRNDKIFSGTIFDNIIKEYVVALESVEKTELLCSRLISKFNAQPTFIISFTPVESPTLFHFSLVEKANSVMNYFDKLSIITRDFSLSESEYNHNIEKQSKWLNKTLFYCLPVENVIRSSEVARERSLGGYFELIDNLFNDKSFFP